MGSDAFAQRYFAAKVEEWKEEIKTLASFAKAQSHAGHAALTHGLIGHWIYALRVSTLSSDELLQPLEEANPHTLLLALTGQPAPSSNLQDLLALPVRLGGMGLINPLHLRADAC